MPIGLASPGPLEPRADHPSRAGRHGATQLVVGIGATIGTAARSLRRGTLLPSRRSHAGRQRPGPDSPECAKRVSCFCENAGVSSRPERAPSTDEQRAPLAAIARACFRPRPSARPTWSWRFARSASRGRFCPALAAPRASRRFRSRREQHRADCRIGRSLLVRRGRAAQRDSGAHRGRKRACWGVT